MENVTKKQPLEKRMYFLVIYNASPIQQGIQAGHAQNEYTQKYWLNKDFQDWSKNWKTWIILNGGTSNNIGKSLYCEEEYYGTMEQNLTILKDNNVNCEPFYEPDLNNSLTAIAFIVDERVFNKTDYPDLKDYLLQQGILNKTEYLSFKEINSLIENKPKPFHMDVKRAYKQWLELIGGKQNEFLKNFLSTFKKA